MGQGIFLKLGVIAGIVVCGPALAQTGPIPLPLAQQATGTDFLLPLDTDDAEARAQAAQLPPRPEDFPAVTTNAPPIVANAPRGAATTEIPPVQVLRPNWAIGVYR